MLTSSVQDSRIKYLNTKDVQAGEFVLYWMQASVRAEHNYALEFAVQQANELAKPLLVVFGLMDDYPEANVRHYTFMLEGLADVAKALEKRGIKLVVKHGYPPEVAIALAQRASTVITDRGYLKLQRAWREQLANSIECSCVQVEDNVVVPVELVTDKQEYAARTIRPKLTKHLDSFLLELQEIKLDYASLDLAFEGLDVSDPYALVNSLKLDASVPAVTQFFKGGTQEAKRVLTTFLENHFETYAVNRNQSQTNDTSYMAMYLHFGQISPIYIALEIRKANAKTENTESYLEELIVRRELAMNYTHYSNDYDSFDALPDWAKKTLKEHEQDKRAPSYSLQDLEDAQTHDPYWNASMLEMRHTGYMHNYMRMYWAKKILEWTATPRDAFEHTLYLNNKYFLDGRDPNSYTGVAWCYGVHDRAWTERPIFGKLRYMNANGLKRKAKPDEYVKKVAALVAKAKGESLPTDVKQEGLF